ncbi:ABC transporter permease [Streptomyces sp. PA03-6a]|nr:ABC transporter permease [Streptomyces sp. PA03-6a]
MPPFPQQESRMDPVRELKSGALTAVLVAVAGVVLGLLWLWLAPRIPLVSDGKAVYLKDTEGEQAIGADGVFVLLGLGIGVLTGVVVFWRNRRGGVGVVLGMAVGAVLGSLLAWRLGTWLGPTSDLIAHARAVGAKKVFDGPLALQAKGALLAWPIGAVLTHLLLTTGFGPRDEQPPTVQWTPPPPGA